MEEPMSVLKEEPTNPVPDTYKPTGAREYTVSDNDSWEKLAQELHMHPWDLIDFNFPGMKPLWRSNAQRACRQINWYLVEYIGCEKSTDKYNYDFSSGLTRGRGVHRGGKIFLPIPDAASDCRTIDIPSDTDSPGLLAALEVARARPPTEARCLHSVELAFARLWYSNSLVYEDIYVSEAEGVGGRSFTIALPWHKGWIVVLNLGPKGFNDPAASNKATLVHELAHAWQSQHHPDPWAFMINSWKCHREAAEATVRSVMNRLRRAAGPVKNLGYGARFSEASPYAWAPGKRFSDYGSEQIAQQVQDSWFPPGGVAPRTNGAIVWHMRTAPPGKLDPANIRSLSRDKGYEYRDTPNVVWHPA
jgi:hypothetical protein